jgi:hypothetical protein
MDPATAAAIVAIVEKLPYVGPTMVVVLPFLMAVISICSVIATKLPAPTTTGGFYFWVYTLVNWGALAVGHATSLSAPASAGIVGGPNAITAPQISIASMPLAAAEAFPAAVDFLTPVFSPTHPVVVPSVPPNPEPPVSK